MSITSADFAFLEIHDEQLVRLTAPAEHHFADDPNTSTFIPPTLVHCLSSSPKKPIWGMPRIGLNTPPARGNILKLDSP